MAKSVLASCGAVALIGHGAAYLLRTTGGPEVLAEVTSPKGDYKVVHSVYLGSAIASHCHDVVAVYRKDDVIHGTHESPRVYVGSCQPSGPVIKWLSNDSLQIGFSMSKALENIAEVRVKPHAINGAVKVSFVVND